MQAGVADIAELAEHLEVGAGLGQHAAGLEKQLVEVAVERHAVGFQRGGHGGITAAFVNAVFLVDVHRRHRQFAAQLAQCGGRLVPSCGVADQQGNVQLAKGCTQFAQVTQPEVHFARRIVMGQPLFRRDQVNGRDRAPLARGGQGGVVV